MYFREKTTYSGTVLQLIEAYRDISGNPRQSIVISLGHVDVPQALRQSIAGAIEDILHGTSSLIEPEPEVKRWATLIVQDIQRKGWISAKQKQQAAEINTIQVNPSQIQHEHTTELGPALVVKRAWDALAFQAILRSLGWSQTQINTAQLSISNRLIDACSEHALSGWVASTSFPDLLETPSRALDKDRFYRVTDLLLEHKTSIEEALTSHEQSLFSLKRTIYLYDVSNTYFEGDMLRNNKAKRGNSKEKRSDAPLVAFGMVLDSNGFVIKHETFAGNTADVTTLDTMIAHLNQDTTLQEKPIIIMDSGIASQDNIRWLKQQGYHYLVVGKRPTRASFIDDFANLSFTTIAGRQGDVQVACKDEGDERIVLCYSEARGNKEQAILSTAEQRFQQDLKKFDQRLQKGLLVDPKKAERALGKLLGHHPRIAKYYDVRIERTSTLLLKYSRREELFSQAEDLTGCYYLRSSKRDMTADEIWKTYMMLTRVEASFKALKSHLGLRPIFHHREDRCDSHIFITILAYHLLQWIEFTLKSHGELRSWSTIRRLLQTHAYTTIIAPAKNGMTYHIRTAGIPDVEQQRLYNLLDIDWKNLPRKQTIV